jgi:uncharacterized protein (DUF58 family)
LAADRPSSLQLSAERLAARLPPLMVAAQRVAETVAQGWHGRRRVGPGESFWQFRPYMWGDRPQAIDWRTSAKGDTVYVREMEWEAAATVYLWRDRSASMTWHSRRDLPTKRERADLILLALTTLLLRGGERVALLAPGERPRLGRSALPLLAERIAREAEEAPAASDALPAGMLLPRHARVALIGDFLTPLPELEAKLRQLARNGLHGQLVLLLDPAEVALPYRGRVRFEGLEGETSWLAPRAENLHEAYGQKLREHVNGLGDIARALGWRLQQHLTDQSAVAALLDLHVALAADRHEFSRGLGTVGA